ncbi:hypothetical protein FFI87_001770 [Burkholderia sp. KBS0801]|nr:hypothetical protein FFI87_001770 [Burkholderia sp. KBS0801]
MVVHGDTVVKGASKAVEPFFCCRRSRSRRETARPTVVGRASPGPPEFGIYATNQRNSNKNLLIEPQLKPRSDLVPFYWGRIVLVQKEAAPAAPPRDPPVPGYCWMGGVFSRTFLGRPRGSGDTRRFAVRAAHSR